MALASVCLTAGAASLFSQTPVSIPNSSFESASGYNNTPSWTSNFSAGNGSASSAVEVRTDSYSGKDQSNYLNLYVDNSSGGGTSTAYLYSTGLGNFQANTVYTLTVALATNNSDTSRNAIFGLQANGTTVGTTSRDGSQLSSSLTDYTYTVDTGNNTGIVGQSISVVLAHSHAGSWGRPMYFDHVRLTATSSGGGGGGGSSSSISNHSFEDSSGYGNPSDWTNSFSAGSGSAVSTIEVRTDSYSGKDQSNYLNLYVDNGSSSATSTAYLYSENLGTYQADTEYTLTVAVSTNNLESYRTASIGLQANGSTVGTTSKDGDELTTSLTDYTYTVDTGNNTGIVGQTIRVVLAHTHSGSYGRPMYFDNVRLSTDGSSGGGGSPGGGGGVSDGSDMGAGNLAEYHIGIGVGAPIDYERGQIYADLIRVARAMENVNGTVGSDGWVTSGTANILVTQGGTSYGGTYALRYDGQADVAIPLSPSGSTISSATYDSGSNTSTRTITIPNQGSNNTTLRLDFSNTTNGVQNVKLMRPIEYGSSTPHNFDEVFARDIKELHEPFEWIRFMDFLATNWNKNEYWSDRTKPTRWSYNWSKSGYGWQGVGGPYEHCVQYCNETSTDMWITIPPAATDTYMLKLAQLIRYGSDGDQPYTSGAWDASYKEYKGLDPDLKVYFEYSNEVWNFSFGQFGFVGQLATATPSGHPIRYDGSSDEGTLRSRFWMWRTKVASDTFRDVFGDDAMMTRIRPLFESQEWIHPYIGVAFRFMDEYQNNGAGVNYVSDPHPLNYYVWGGGHSTYIHNIQVSSDPVVWQYDPNQMTMNSYYNTVIPGLLPNWIENNQRVVDWMRVWGLKRVAYEGSPTIETGYPPEPLRDQIQQDSRQTDQYKDMVEQFVKDGGDMYTNFLTINTTHGITWSRQELDTPRTDAVDELITENPPARTYGTALPANIWGGRYKNHEDGYSVGSNNGPVSLGASTWVGYVVLNNGSSDTTYSLSLNAGSASSGNEVNVWVDGELKGTLTVPNTGSTSSYQDSSSINITLSPGQHGIRLDGVTGSYDDYRVNQLKIQ